MAGLVGISKYSPAKMLAEKGPKALSPAAMLADEMKGKKTPQEKIVKTARDERKKMIEEIS